MSIVLSPDGEDIIGRIGKYFESLKESSIFIEGEEVTTKVWEKFKDKVNNVFAVGHGDHDVYLGYKEQPVFWVGMEKDGFTYDIGGTNFMFFSCQVAKDLIPYLEKKGAKGAGFLKDYVIFYDPSKDALEDKTLSLFVEPFMKGIDAVKETNNISDALVVREELIKNSSNADQEVSEALLYDANIFYVSGVETQKLSTIGIEEILPYVIFIPPALLLLYGILKK
ncbi:MAG: hypothetical protein JTT12_05460 [Candidatus Brockarchaeota archaeon]|nr:hypothetical protein [Candidatus Brockarchaeota archaeon]